MTDLEKFSAMSERCAGSVIATYSTSFSLASSLLAPKLRHHIRNLYAVVRIADEIVDGVAAEAGLSPAEIANLLDSFEAETFAAIERGFSTNPALHAFAGTAEVCHLNPEHLRSFFDSMRADLAPKVHTAMSRERYVFGSAEVIGLMCLDIFTYEKPLSPQDHEKCVTAARHLGKAFQLINFLRDYHTDEAELGRVYVQLTEESKQELITEIRQDLNAAMLGIPVLPLGARTGVLAAFYLFEDLTNRLDAASVADIAAQRVRVPASRKTVLAARALAAAGRM